MSSRQHARIRTSCRASGHLKRRGAVTIELLVALPVLIVIVLAVLQFGYYFTGSQQLALASRVGADEAAQTPGLPAAGAVPLNIANAINRQLASAGITPVAIIVEHNTAGPKQVLRTDFVPNTCPEPTSILPFETVRVTVCVPLTDLMPNCLSTLGFDLTGRFAQVTTTFGYEL